MQMPFMSNKNFSATKSFVPVSARMGSYTKILQG